TYREVFVKAALVADSLTEAVGSRNREEHPIGYRNTMLFNAGYFL
ncbi:hypothetical protein LINPERHAP1_LOCUS38232, partial [Linum perenne]